MRNRLIHLLAALLLFAGAPQARAGIPVIDVANLAQAIVEVTTAAEQLTQLIEQLRELKRHYEQARQHYDAIRSGRGLAGVLNDPALRDYIPRDARGVLAGIDTGGYAGLSSAARSLRRATMTYNCEDVVEGARRTRCETELGKPYQYKAYYEDGLQRAGGRTAQIQGLMERAGTTADPKEMGELQARIGAETALLQHEMSQIALAQGLAQADARIAESQARESQREAATRRGRLFEGAGK